MNRRQMMTGAAGLIGSLAVVTLPGGRRAMSGAAAQTPVPVGEIEAVGAKVHAGDEVALRPGLAVRFLGVSRDSRCPADLQCFVAGSADVALAFTEADERQNTRTFDQVVEFPLNRKILVYDTDAVAVVADLSSDSDVEEADLVLSLYLVVLDGSNA